MKYLLILFLMLSTLTYSQERGKVESISIEKKGVSLPITKIRNFKIMRNGDILIETFHRERLIGKNKTYVV